MYVYSETQILQGIMTQLSRGNHLMEDLLSRHEQLEKRLDRLEQGTEEKLKQQSLEIRSRMDDLLLRL